MLKGHVNYKEENSISLIAFSHRLQTASETLQPRCRMFVSSFLSFSTFLNFCSTVSSSISACSKTTNVSIMLSCLMAALMRICRVI